VSSYIVALDQGTTISRAIPFDREGNVCASANQEFKQYYPRPGWVRLRTVPTYAAWLDVLEPISRVFPMAGLDNTMRGLVVSGTPVVMGLHAMGDFVCTTTATVVRGLSLPLSGTVDLLDTI